MLIWVDYSLASTAFDNSPFANTETPLTLRASSEQTPMENRPVFCQFFVCFFFLNALLRAH